jgi:hypothetical protein
MTSNNVAYLVRDTAFPLHIKYPEGITPVSLDKIVPGGGLEQGGHVPISTGMMVGSHGSCGKGKIGGGISQIGFGTVQGNVYFKTTGTGITCWQLIVLYRDRRDRNIYLLPLIKSKNDGADMNMI